MTWTDDDVQTTNCDNRDDNNALKEVLFLHYLNLKCLATFFRFVDTGYCASCHLKNCFVCASDKEACIAHRSNHPDDATVCDHSVVDLESSNSVLKLPLSLLLRANQQNVEHAHYQNDRQH